MNQPQLMSMDLIGAPMTSTDFIVSGTCKANLYGACEALFRPQMVIITQVAVSSLTISRIPKSFLKLCRSVFYHQWIEML